MARFTKTNKTIQHDGIVDFTDNQSMGGDYSNPLSPVEGSRVINAAAAVDDNDYVIKSQVIARISEDTTFYVRSTGSDSNDGLTEDTAWAHPQYAANVIANYVVDEGKTLTVDIGPGVYNGIDDNGDNDPTLPVLDINNKNFNNVIFKGSISEEINILSISGTSSLVLTLNTAVADLDITNNSSFFIFSFNGQSHAAMAGVYKITAHNDISNTITLAFVGYLGVNMVYPTGTGKGYVINTVFRTSGSFGIRLTNTTMSLQNICMHYSESSPSSKTGVYIENGSSFIASYCGVVNFGEGYRATTGSVIKYSDTYASTCDIGVLSLNGSSIIGSYSETAGCIVGIKAELSSSIWVNGARFVNCTTLILSIRNSSVNINHRNTTINKVTYYNSTTRADASYLSLVRLPNVPPPGAGSVGGGIFGTDSPDGITFGLVVLEEPSA